MKSKRLLKWGVAAAAAAGAGAAGYHYYKHLPLPYNEETKKNKGAEQALLQAQVNRDAADQMLAASSGHRQPKLDQAASHIDAAIAWWRHAWGLVEKERLSAAAARKKALGRVAIRLSELGQSINNVKGTYKLALNGGPVMQANVSPDWRLMTSTGVMVPEAFIPLAERSPGLGASAQRQRLVKGRHYKRPNVKSRKSRGKVHIGRRGGKFLVRNGRREYIT